MTDHEEKMSKIMKIIKDNHPHGVQTAAIDKKIFPPNGIPGNNKTYYLIKKLLGDGKIKPAPIGKGTGSPWILAREE